MKAQSFSEALRSAAWALRADRARTAAVVLSLACAIAASTLCGAILAGASRQIQHLAFGDFGRAIVVRENVFVPDRFGPPTLADRERLLNSLPKISTAAAWSAGGAQAWDGQGYVHFRVYGGLGDYRREVDAPIVAGRFPSEAEMAGDEPFCLVGSDLAKRLGLERAEDSVLRTTTITCRIVGVLGEPRSRPARRYADAVVAPFRVAKRYFSENDDSRPEAADWLTLYFEPGAILEDARYSVDRHMRRAYGLGLGAPSPFIYDDPGGPIREQRAQQAQLARLLYGLSGLTLVASLIAYSAIVSAALAARAREVAHRLALGAQPGDIVAQFLAENLISGLGGSLIGLATGLAGAWMLSSLWGWPFAPSLAGVVIALTLGLGIGAAIGAVAGLRAAAIRPALAAAAGR